MPGGAGAALGGATTGGYAGTSAAQGGASGSAAVDVPSQRCEMAVGDWCEELFAGDSLRSYFIALNGKGNVILAGQSGDDLVAAEYTPGGQILWSHTFGTDEYDFAEGLAIDADDNIVVGGSITQIDNDGTQPIVTKLSPQGRVLWQREPGGSLRSTGLTLDASGNAILVTQTPDVVAYSPEGDLLWKWASDKIPGAGSPLIDASGNILLVTSNGTNETLTKLSPTGAWLSDTPFDAADPSPGAGVLDQNGELLFVSLNNDNTRTLWRYSLTKDLVWKVALTKDLYTADNLALDAHRNIFIVGMANDFGEPYYDSYLAKYDPDGNLLWGMALGERGGIGARGLAVGADGAVFMCGTSKSGAFVTRFTAP